jgi:hypothetical protein
MVDGSSLLLPYFFPRTGAFSGVFTNNVWSDFMFRFSKSYASRWGMVHGAKSSFFSPWTSGSGRHRGSGGEPVFRFPTFRHDWASVLGHCNGLLLLEADLGPGPRRDYYVCNPATVRRLPPPSDGEPWPDHEAMVLAFDPGVSGHHEVFHFLKDDVQDKIRLYLPELFREEQLFEKDPKPTYAKLGYSASRDDLGKPVASRLDVSVDQLHGQLQELPLHVPRAEDPCDEVVSVLVFSSRTGQWARREFVPGRCVLQRECTTWPNFPRMPIMRENIGVATAKICHKRPY